MTSLPNPKLPTAELDRLIELASAYREDRIEGKALAELVRNDANQQISILLVAETESKKGMLLHAFASSQHETLRPPTLHLWFEP